MKIIAKSEENLEDVRDILIAENVNPNYAGLIVSRLNRWASDSPQYEYTFKVVTDSYKLYAGVEEEL
ncbi:MAG: hypothetical protein OEY89_02445 [Gammaproteobacteria bacterium]|nr:hypothetical protein [Gammaproteobacteria bacterium]